MLCRAAASCHSFSTVPFSLESSRQPWNLSLTGFRSGQEKATFLSLKCFVLHSINTWNVLKKALQPNGVCFSPQILLLDYQDETKSTVHLFSKTLMAHSISSRCLFLVIFMWRTSGVFTLRGKVSAPPWSKTEELRERHKTMWQGAGELKHIITGGKKTMSQSLAESHAPEMNSPKWCPTFPLCSRGVCIVKCFHPACQLVWGLNIWPMTFFYDGPPCLGCSHNSGLCFFITTNWYTLSQVGPCKREMQTFKNIFLGKIKLS